MTSALRFGLIIAAVGALGAAFGAHALQLNHAGAACLPVYGSEMGNFDRPFGADGIRNITNVGRFISCPLVHSPASDFSAAVYIDGRNAGTETTSCGLYSYSWDQTSMASSYATGGGTPNAAWFRYLSLPARTVSTFSHLHVVCYLPPLAVITSVEVMR